MIAIAGKAVRVQAVHHVRAHRLRLELSNGKVTGVDFEPVFHKPAPTVECGNTGD
jgi:hypothetical protein